MRHSDITPVGPPGHGPAYAVTPGRTGRDVGLPRLGFCASPLWWRVEGYGAGRIVTTTRRAQRSSTTRRRMGPHGRLLFLVHGITHIEARTRIELEARALALAADLTTAAMNATDPTDPLAMPMPDGARLVWGTWTAWQHPPNREETTG